MIYFDAHIHIQNLFSLDIFLENSLRNFSRQITKNDSADSGTFFLLLTEGKKMDYFSLLKKESIEHGNILPEAWQVKGTREAESLLLRHKDWQETRLFIVAGRQIVTREKVEVLALGTVSKFDDAMPVKETIELVRNKQGLAVLPWGAGKWLGKRGKIIRNLITSTPQEGLFVGDNGGRPLFWPTPAIFAQAAKRGIRLLPGSDPLPLAQEEQRAGSFGGFIRGECSATTPWTDLRSLMNDPKIEITPFGKNQAALRFFKTQIALRLKS